GIALAASLAGLTASSAASRWGSAVGGLAAALLLIAVSAPAFDGTYEALTYKSGLAPGEGVTHTVETKRGIANGTRKGEVFGGGIYDGIIATDLLDDENLLIRPISLSLFHRDPERVLLVGLGTGAWAQILVNNPAVKHLTAIEINPGYLDIIRRYPAVAS